MQGICVIFLLISLSELLVGSLTAKYSFSSSSFSDFSFSTVLDRARCAPLRAQYFQVY